MLHLNPFLVQLFDNLLGAETALLHSLQRWCQSKDRFLYGHGSIPVQRDGSGFESGKLLSDFLQLCCSDSHDGLPVFRRDHAPDGRFVFPVERDGRPHFTQVKPSGPISSACAKISSRRLTSSSCHGRSAPADAPCPDLPAPAAVAPLPAAAEAVRSACAPRTRYAAALFPAEAEIPDSQP